MPNSAHTWDIASGFPSTSSSKLAPTPMRALSKRRGVHWVQYTHPSSDSAHAYAHGPPVIPSTYYAQTQSDTRFPRQCASDEALRDTREHVRLQDSSFAQSQRAVRRKKSSFDLRDLFLTGGVPPGHRAPSASET
ncbi:hypothetical protein TRAPUB_12574 [Trametes pubescens]|uniref:Uncharacterized protein n=1 Tax=Trametes pubescens TaxID=154538 RepID=A0A1M2VTP2_TRAPU|nr:hypothetical protein TRAPUB_12574 [Trametes pubescens]